LTLTPHSARRLATKLDIALTSYERQSDVFDELSSSIDPENRAQWQDMVDEYLADKSKPNPYVACIKSCKCLIFV